MTIIQTQHGPYLFTTWGGGTAASLRQGDREIFWQGDEAADITDRFTDAFYEEGEDVAALDAIWDEYEAVAQRDQT